VEQRLGDLRVKDAKFRAIDKEEGKMGYCTPNSEYVAIVIATSIGGVQFGIKV
jgi:hypothetical protein